MSLLSLLLSFYLSLPLGLLTSPLANVCPLLASPLSFLSPPFLFILLLHLSSHGLNHCVAFSTLPLSSMYSLSFLSPFLVTLPFHLSYHGLKDHVIFVLRSKYTLVADLPSVCFSFFYITCLAPLFLLFSTSPFNLLIISPISLIPFVIPI